MEKNFNSETLPCGLCMADISNEPHHPTCPLWTDDYMNYDSSVEQEKQKAGGAIVSVKQLTESMEPVLKSNQFDFSYKAGIRSTLAEARKLSSSPSPQVKSLAEIKDEVDEAAFAYAYSPDTDAVYLGVIRAFKAGAEWQASQFQSQPVKQEASVEKLKADLRGLAKIAKEYLGYQSVGNAAKLNMALELLDDKTV